MSERIPFSKIPEGLMPAMMQVEGYVNGNGLDIRLLELIRFRASQINGCAYCLDMHYKEALAADEKPLRLYSVSAWREASYYTPPERAVLAWTEALVEVGTGADLQELFINLQKHFNDSEIANLTIAISQINAWNILAKSFGFTPGQYKVGAH